MHGLPDKISSYNIFNFLLPGILFAIITDAVTDYRIVQDDLVVGLFLYYFIGLVISRIGSLLVEPVLKKLGLIPFVNYDNFIEASMVDLKIYVLSETNNMYRTFCALFLVLPLVSGLDRVVPSDPVLYIVGGILLVTFLFAYRRQTNYIAKRIDKAVKRPDSINTRQVGECLDQE